MMDMARVEAYLEARRGDFEEQLKVLIRIPSVSAQPDHNADTRRARHWCATTWQRWALIPN